MTSIYLLYLIGFLDLFGVSMVIPLLVKHCKTLGASPFTAGIIGSTYGLIQFFSGPIIGKYSDQYGRKLMLQMCFLTSIFSYLLLGSSNHLLVVFLSRIPIGIFKHCQELSKCLIADTVTVKERSSVFGKFNSISNIGFIFGPLVGSYLYEQGGGIHHVTFATSFLFMINLFIITFLVPKGKYATDAKTRRQLNNQSMLSFLQRITSWKFMSCIWVILLIRFLLSFSNFIYRYDLASTLGAKKIGIIMSFSGSVSAISGFFTGAIVQLYSGDHKKLLLHISLIQAVCIAVLTMYEELWLQLLFTVPLSVVNALARVVAVSMTIDLAKKKDLGVVAGLGSSTIAISRFLAPLAGGLVQEVYLSGPGYVGAMVSLLSAIFVGLVDKVKVCKRLD
ncbi:hypothetical protein HELRODRAFT_88474 [Helobdella robusta]|uniref:Major facilitator superfamily (MFS) profile domain-containing protein n=1 Tax=Helobdella robusta TaxID=6412 RepID=T1G730_HELRO|nr:hypothetical protein HELRODRAFT_88474 [Helobdella robusta]ESN93692.1 hypothetical protein HELRODRAFT_88474 [Helobdella robusta]